MLKCSEQQSLSFIYLCCGFCLFLFVVIVSAEVREDCYENLNRQNDIPM